VTLHPGAACTAGGLDPEAAPGALRWVEISSGAWTAGLRPADRLIEVGGAPFDPAAGPAALLIQPGESLDLLVERPGVGELDIDVPCPL
jgi:C-terminal processing protease CtpA/Prc